MRITTLIILVFCSAVACAQDKTIDSLQKILSTQKEDTNRVNTLLELSHACTATEILLYAQPALELSIKLNYQKGMAAAYGDIGTDFFYKHKSSEAIENHQKALQIYMLLKDKQGIGDMYAELGNDYSQTAADSMASYYIEKSIAINKEFGAYTKIAVAYTSLGVVSNGKGESFKALQYYELAYEYCLKGNSKEGAGYNLNNIGGIYQNFGKHELATEYFLRSLKVREEIHDTIGMASCYKNLALGFETQKLRDQALLNFEKSLRLYELINDSIGIAYILNCLGDNYLSYSDYNKAKDYFLKCLAIVEKVGNSKRLLQVHESLGRLYQSEGNYEQALVELNKSLVVAKSAIKKNAPGVLVLIGQVYFLRNDFARAEQNGEEALKGAIESGHQKVIRDASKLLSDIYAKQGKYKESLNMYISYKNSCDSILSSETQKSVASKIFMYEVYKKEAENKLLATENKLQAATLSKQEQQKQVIYISILAAIAISGYGFYRFRKNKQIENQQSLLNERLRISRELHDDMGSTLSSISVYSEVAKNRAAKNENETEVLQKIGNASRELIEKMSDIVWSLNPNNENFEQLKNRMMAFAAMMLTPKGILFEFEIDDEVKSTAIAPEQRKNIFLIYKEAINNIVKYSEAKEVKVKVKVKENKLCLEILDNGKGFDTNNVVAYNGNGLKNMKARAEEIKALFNVTSRINEGVKIEFAFSI